MKQNLTFNIKRTLLFTVILGISSILNAQDLSEDIVCRFEIGQGSTYSGTYTVKADGDNAFAYDDFENEQFVIEMHGDNYIDIMLILENLSEGKHPFTMEMQVAIDISKDEGENYVNFSNRFEEKGGHIDITKIDKETGIIEGSFSGLFLDDSSDVTVDLKGKFKVKKEQR